MAENPFHFQPFQLKHSGDLIGKIFGRKLTEAMKAGIQFDMNLCLPARFTGRICQNPGLPQAEHGLGDILLRRVVKQPGQECGPE